MKTKSIGVFAMTLLLMIMAAGTAIAPATEVGVDIKPYSQPNAINVKANGVIPVAILGTTAFDVTTINASTVVFGGVGPVMAAYEDANGDGITDLVLHFNPDRNELACMLVDGQEIEHGPRGLDGYLTLTGFLYNGAPIEGQDTARLLHASMCA